MISTLHYLAHLARSESQHLQQLEVLHAQPNGQVKMIQVHYRGLYGCTHAMISMNEQAQCHSTPACGLVVHDGIQSSQLDHLCCDMPPDTHCSCTPHSPITLCAPPPSPPSTSVGFNMLKQKAYSVNEFHDFGAPFLNGQWLEALNEIVCSPCQHHHLQVPTFTPYLLHVGTECCSAG